VLRASPYATKSGAAALRSHSNPWAHTRGHILPKRRSLRWADLRDRDRSDLLLQVSTGAPGIARSPRTTGVHPASTRMQTSARTRRLGASAGYPQAHEKANYVSQYTRSAGSSELTPAAKDVPSGANIRISWIRPRGISRSGRC
jgi:hypothetical protein